MSNESKKQILKATGIIGGTQFFTIFIGIIRTKVLAILLGPYGLGVVGMLQSIIDIVRNLTGFGLNFSAVKDVAEADSLNNNEKLNDTITVLRNLVLWTGLFGVFVTIILAKPLSTFTFGDSRYTTSIIYLSITLLLSSIAGGQMALLQGKREIKLMAKSSLYGAIYSTIVSIIVYYLLGIKGIVPVLILTSVIPLIFSYHYSRKIKFQTQKISFRDSLSKGFGMAKLGFFIVITGFMASLTLYFIRAIIVARLNVEAVGFFQASWMISTTYIGVILNAMLSDFFPRLSAINNDQEASNKLINEQLEIALVIGTPLILILIASSELLIKILYSASFLSTTSILQWQLFGSFFTLISWPLGVLFLAKNKGRFSIITDGFWSILFLSIVFFGWKYYGFIILGIGDSIAIILKLFLVYFIVKNIADFKFTINNIKNILFYGIFSVLMMLNVTFSESYLQYMFSLVFIAAVGIKSLITLYEVYQLKDKFKFVK